MMRRGFAAMMIAMALPWGMAGRVARGADVEILAGPMVGHVTDVTARIWLQLNLAGKIEIRVIDLQSERAVSALALDVDGPQPFICDVPLNSLEPDHSYRMEVKFEGKSVALPGPETVIRTAPSAGEVTTFSTAFGSGLYTPAPAPDDPNGGLGTPKGGDAPIFKRITELKPREFFFLGNAGFLPQKLEDFPPTRRPAFRFLCDSQARTRREPDLQELFRTTPCYSVYDDRDFGTPDADRTFVYLPESNLAFQRYWPNPTWGTPEHPGCYCTFSCGDVDFFLLDVRSYRDPLPSPPPTSPGKAGAAMAGGEGRKMLGDLQLQWLEENLKKSKAAFKVIGAPCALFDGDASEAGNSWLKFPEEQAAFMKWLGANQISGIVAMAGDQPLGQITHVEPKSPAVAGELHYPLITVGCSTLNTIPKNVRGAASGGGTRPLNAVAENNFGTMDFGGDRNHRFVTLRLRDEMGKARAEQTVFLEQLQN